MPFNIRLLQEVIKGLNCTTYPGSIVGIVIPAKILFLFFAFNDAVVASGIYDGVFC